MSNDKNNSSKNQAKNSEILNFDEIPDGYHNAILEVVNGDKSNKNNVGLYYQYAEKNYDMAKKNYLKAIKQKNVDAMRNLAYFYYETEPNFALCKKYSLMAIENGNIDALNILGSLYQRRGNKQLGEKYFLQGVDKGDPNSMYNLGQYYQFHDVNTEKSKKYYLMASKQGIPEAMSQLGNYYIYENNFKMAKKYYLMAIEGGDTLAMYNLASEYEKRKEYKNAKKYYAMAIKNSDVNAMFKLAELYNNVENNKKQAEKYYLMALKENTNYYNRDIIDICKQFMDYDKLAECCKKIDFNEWYDNDLIDKYLKWKVSGDAETKDIRVLINRIKNTSKKQKCPICSKIKDCIMFECCHRTCIHCYIRVVTDEKQCPICKIPIDT